MTENTTSRVWLLQKSYFFLKM